MIKTNKDIPVGSIVFSKSGKKYLVLTDDAGQRGLFTDKGTWMRFVGDTLTFGKSGDGAIDTIKAFDTLPTLDAISEGIKYLYTGRTTCAPLTTVYTAEDPRVTQAKAALAQLDADADAIAAKKAALMDTIRRYS